MTASSEGVDQSEAQRHRHLALLRGGRRRAPAGAAILQRCPDPQQDHRAVADSQPGDARGRRLCATRAIGRRRTATYLVAESDKMGTAYVVGARCWPPGRRWAARGGALGYPISDLSAGRHPALREQRGSRRQSGAPGQRGILTKWGLLGYETGAAGAPVSDVDFFSTFGANSGSSAGLRRRRRFIRPLAGPRSPQAYFVTGLILLRYNALGGPGGDYGMPTSDEFVTAGLHQQNFEGGNITWSAGDSAAKEHPGGETPGLIVSPSTLPAGSRAQFRSRGLSQQQHDPDLDVQASRISRVTTPTAPIPGTCSFRSPPRAAHGGARGRRQGSQHRPTAPSPFAGSTITASPLAKVQGDNQTGPPGALLPLALRVALRDSAGDPVVGAAVTFEASSGAQLSAASARHRFQRSGRDPGPPSERRGRNPGARGRPDRCLRLP